MLFAAARPEPWLVLALVAVFAAVVAIIHALFQLLGKGFQSYEERYVTGATRTLDAMYLSMSAQQILALSALSSLLVFIVMVLSTRSFLWAGVPGVIAFFGPTFVIHMLKRRRDRRFGEQLVDGLVAMGNALRVGHSLPAAFELLAREMENPMGQEMRLLVQELRLGVSLDDALAHLHERMPSEDLDILITSIVISREVGGNLAEIFDNIADTIRERHRIHGKIASLTAQGKLQAVLVCALPVVVCVFLNAWNPEFFRPMYTTKIGAAMLLGAGLMDSVGAWMIWRIVSIKV